MAFIMFNKRRLTSRSLMERNNARLSLMSENTCSSRDNPQAYIVIANISYIVAGYIHICNSAFFALNSVNSVKHKALASLKLRLSKMES